jgi:hypothetical protein
MKDIRFRANSKTCPETRSAPFPIASHRPGMLPYLLELTQVEKRLNSPIGLSVDVVKFRTHSGHPQFFFAFRFDCILGIYQFPNFQAVWRYYLVLDFLLF